MNPDSLVLDAFYNYEENGKTELVRYLGATGDLSYAFAKYSGDVSNPGDQVGEVTLDIVLVQLKIKALY